MINEARKNDLPIVFDAFGISTAAVLACGGDVGFSNLLLSSCCFDETFK
jgi:hypothetical protein